MKKNIKNEKMVLVEGKWIAESKAEGRRAAIANGRRINIEMKAALSETRRDEVRELREKGWSEDEISQHFLARNAEEATSHGFIRPARAFRAPKVNYGPSLMFH